MNCKQGDLAYIVKAPFGGPTGIVVEVESLDQVHQVYGHLWLCRSRTPLPTVSLGNRHDVLVADDWLRPISGVPVHDEVTDDLEATA